MYLHEIQPIYVYNNLDTKILIKQLLCKGKKNETKRKEFRVLNILICELKLIYIRIYKIVYFVEAKVYLYICYGFFFVSIGFAYEIIIVYIYICIKD